MTALDTNGFQMSTVVHDILSAMGTIPSSHP